MYLKNDLISVLANNEFVAEYKNVPEYVDNRDEIITEVQETLDDDGYLPDSMRYFLVNGKTNANEITDYLKKLFEHFKIEFLDGNNDAALITELLNQFESIKKNVSQAIYEAKQIKDETLIEIMVVKLRLCDEAINFIMNTRDNNERLGQEEELPKDIIYYFSVNKEFTESYEISLNNLYYELKDELKLIECTIIEFKNLFRPHGITYRKSPKPIIWTSGVYSHLSYFITYLKDKKFIPDSKRPSFNQIAIKLFYNKTKGEFFENKSIKSDVKDPDIPPYADIKQMVNEILKN